MAVGRLIKGGTDYFGIFYRALHVSHFFRAFINEQNDQIDFRVIGADGIGNGLEQNGFACAGRCDDKCALAAPDGGHKIYDARRHIFGVRLHAHLLIGINRGKVVKKYQMASQFRLFKADFVDSNQSEITFTFSGGTYLS